MPMGSIHSYPGAQEYRGTLLGWHSHKGSGRWVGFWSIHGSFPGKIWKDGCGCEVEQVIQEVEIAKSKGLETCSWNNENSSPHHLDLHPPLLPSFHLISERVILSHRRKRVYSEYLPPSPSRPPAVRFPPHLPACHNFLLSPKHPSRLALCKCKHMWISFLISLFYFTESMPIILEKDETLMQMKHRFGAPGKQGTMGRD